MATAVGHVGIVVRDLNLMIAFFTAGLGLTLSTRFRRRGKFPESVTKAIGADLEIAILGSKSQPRIIELLKYHSHPPDAAERSATDFHTNHIMYLVDDVVETHAAIVRAGGKPFTEPIMAPNRAKTCFYARDPEGGIFEVIHVLDPANEYPPV